MECTLVREQDLYQPEYNYLPDILKEGYVRKRRFSANAESPAEDYGTFARQQEEPQIIQVNED